VPILRHAFLFGVGDGEMQNAKCRMQSAFVQVVPWKVRWCLVCAFVFVVPWMYHDVLFFTQFPCGGRTFRYGERYQSHCAWSLPCMILLEQGTKWWFIALRLKEMSAFCVGSLRFAPAPSPIGCAWG